MDHITLSISGMSCEHCVKAVTNAIAGFPGVKDVAVSLKDANASFKHDSAKSSLDEIIGAITEEGFEVNG